MKTIAQIIGEPDDPIIELIRLEFSSGCGKIEQVSAQVNLTPIQLRKLEWNIAKKIKDKLNNNLFLCDQKYCCGPK